MDFERTGSTSFSGWMECKILLSYKSVTGGGRNISGIILWGGILELSNFGGCDSGLL